MLKFIASSITAICMLMGAAQAEGPLKSTLEAYVVTVAEDGTETLILTEDITPGEVIEYALVYENVGETPLSGIVISAPVPASTVFVEGSASTEVTSIFEVSIDDGATWSVPPLMQETEDGETVIAASEFDMVRWVPDAPIESGTSWRFKYRTSVQ